MHGEPVYPKMGTEFITKGRLQRNVLPKGLTKCLGRSGGPPICFVQLLGSTYILNLPFWNKIGSYFWIHRFTMRCRHCHIYFRLISICNAIYHIIFCNITIKCFIFTTSMCIFPVSERVICMLSVLDRCMRPQISCK